MLPGDALEEVTHPALLLLLGAGEQEQLLGGGHVVVHWGRRGHFKSLEPPADVPSVSQFILDFPQ